MICPNCKQETTMGHYVDAVGMNGGYTCDTIKVAEPIAAQAPCPFNPAGTWLVIEMEKAGDKLTKSSILYVPDTAKDAPQVGRVLAVGPGTRVGSSHPSDAPFFDPCETKVGERILFNKYSGSEIDWPDGRTYLFVKESDIVAYIPEG